MKVEYSRGEKHGSRASYWHGCRVEGEEARVLFLQVPEGLMHMLGRLLVHVRLLHMQRRGAGGCLDAGCSV